MRKILLPFVFVLCVFTSAAFASVSPETVSGATTINAEQAHQLFKSGALIIDTRNTGEFKAGHIPGAVLMDIKKGEFTEAAVLDELDAKTPAQIASAKANEQIIIHCNGVECPRSAAATKLAVEWGFKHVNYFRLGFPAWVSAGYPAVKQ